jgi:cysteine desulfuration protein SufE
MTTVMERQQKIIQEFSAISSWEERYKKLIEKGKALPELPPDLKTAEALVKGCQSQVWLHASLDENKNMVLRADSDALLVKGLVALLLDVFSEAPPKEVLAAPVTFVEEIGLGQHLTPSRANGLFSMIKQIKYFAAAFSMMA